MSNTVVAELACPDEFGQIAEILDFQGDEDGSLRVDVRLTDGSLVEYVDALDVTVHGPARPRLAAA